MQEEQFQPKPQSLWHHADFRRLWVSDTISQFGSQFSGWAIPTIAAFVMNASALEFGILTAVGMAAWPLFALPVGAWVDQQRRKPILVIANIGRAGALAAVPVTWYFRDTTFRVGGGPAVSVFNINVLYIVAFTVGLLTVFFDISYQSYLPSLVDRDQLVEGNSKLEISRSTAQVAGPTISGVAIQLISVPASPLACLGDTIGFTASALFLNKIDKQEHIEPNPEQTSFVSQVREGLSVVVRDGRLRSIAASTSTSNLFSNGLFALIFLYAAQELQIASGSVPLILGIAGSVGSLGGLLGAVTAGRLGKRFGVGRMIIISMFVAEAGALFLAYATPATAIPFMIISFLLGSWGSVVYNVNQVSLRQALVPLKIQGRMNASMRWLVWGTIPIGGLMGGILGTVLGLREAVMIMAFAGLLAGVWVLISPVRRVKVIPTSPLISETGISSA